MFRTLSVCCLLLGMLAVAPADARPPIEVGVKDAYIDLHTGPGRGFPVTISVQRGVTIELLRQRTDWIEVQTARGQRGWVHRSQLENTLTPAGSEVHIAGTEQDARTEYQWEAGIAVFDFDGANVVSDNGADALTPTLLGVSPKAPDTKDSTDATADGGLGFPSYLTDRLLMQAEYRRFVVFTSGDDHEEKDEWIAGVTYFF